MTAAIFAFSEDAEPARRLAEALGLSLGLIGLHQFPDGESLPTLMASTATVIIYRSLARPDEKLMPLLLAADAARRAGARKLILAAPYMPYLRQDAVFAPGQPVSRDVIGQLLGSRFDKVLTVEAHLHRTPDLGPVFAPAEVVNLSAAAPLSRQIGRTGAPLIVGPDAESAPWVAAIARLLRADHFVLNKLRKGDRRIELSMPATAQVHRRRVVLVDDICSTGATLMAAVQHLRLAGAKAVEVAVVHALFGSRTLAALQQAGADSVLSTDSCPNPTNCIGLAPLIAEALQEELR